MSGGQNVPVAEQAGNPRAGEHGALSCGRALSFSRETRADFDRLLDALPHEAGRAPSDALARPARMGLDLARGRRLRRHAPRASSPAFVWGVVTFYTMYNRAPVGKHLIQVCTSISCHLNGAEEVFAECKRRLGGLKSGETSKDGKYTVIEVECLAQCDKAPAVMVNDDDHLVDHEGQARRVPRAWPER